MTEKQLIEMAIDAMNNAYVPYSGFKVGSALLCKSGRVYTGCNIENASFSPTVCAERTAIFKAISEGEKDFEKIVVVGGRDGAITDFCTPCGVCRQVISEFCDDDFPIILYNGRESKTMKLAQMLPYRFRLEK